MTSSDHRSSRRNAANRCTPAGLLPPPSRSNISNLPLPRRHDSSRSVVFLVSPSHLHLLQLSATITTPSRHHRAFIAAPYSRSSMLPRVRTTCSFIHVVGNHHCCSTSESCSSKRELRYIILAPPSKLWKPPRVRHGSHREFAPAPAPSSRSRKNCVDPVHSRAVVDSIASMAATTSHSSLLLPPPSSPTVTPLPPLDSRRPNNTFATISQPPRQPP